MLVTKQHIALSLVRIPLWRKSSFLADSSYDISRVWNSSNPYLCGFSDWEQADRIYSSAVSEGMKVLVPSSPEYPELLRSINDFPVVLFCRGDVSLLSRPCIGMVGSRNITSYGKAVVSRFVPTLVRAGFCVVSGLARGVDAQVHREVLRAGGRTIAVLGSGADMPTPAQNRELYESILSDGGLIVSEYPPGSEASKWTFPQRNRVIAGLSQGVLVVEAGSKSGSLITASLAAGYARDVFAVPGPINSELSVGVNDLIKRGAVICTGPEDILEQYDLLIKSTKDSKPQISDSARRTLGMVTPQGVDLNEMLVNSGVPMEDLLKGLDELEHNGYIGKDNFGIYYLL